jgi:hypothetical protein
MGLLNFLKKKEISEIYQLKSQLERYQSIVDVEAEVAEQKKTWNS